jgi:Uma2 family endonuclease
MPVTEATYERLALEDGDEQWEYVCGHVRKKPPMTQEHESVGWWLAVTIQNQLDREHFEARFNSGRTRRPGSTWLVPDVVVIPVAYFDKTRGTGRLEVYDDPFPFVAEVWSKSTADYDIETKFQEYRKRGDLEIWRLHPYERSVMAWRRQSDGSYDETRYSLDDGEAPVLSLPRVVVKFAEIFE